MTKLSDGSSNPSTKTYINGDGSTEVLLKVEDQFGAFVYITGSVDLTFESEISDLASKLDDLLEEI